MITLKYREYLMALLTSIIGTFFDVLSPVQKWSKIQLASRVISIPAFYSKPKKSSDSQSIVVMNLQAASTQSETI